jgi:DNA-directed RNA polymerase beta subunit
MAQPDLLDYADYDSVRQRLYDSVEKSVTEGFPVENEQYQLKVDNVRYTGPSNYSITDQKKAILEGRSLGRKLTGNYVVIDRASGKPVSKTGRKTLLTVPYLTNRGTFIRNGVENVIMKQFRLTPNVYTRRTDDGSIESQFSVAKGTGAQFRVHMDPNTAVFYYRQQGRKIPLYPVLRASGVEPEVIKQAWGKDIFDVNKKFERSPHAVNFLRQYRPVNMEKKGAQQEFDTEYEDIRPNLLASYEKMRLDPGAVQRTLGVRTDRVTPNLILQASQKILNVNRGKLDTDDRDSLAYQTIHDVTDFLPDKIRNDQNRVAHNLLWKLTNKQGDASKIPSGLLDAHVKHLFNESGLSQSIEGINPLEMYDQNKRVIRLGEGGIPSADVVPKDSRAVQPSYLGYVDPVRAPECYTSDMEVLTAGGWKKWPEVTEEDFLLCLVNGRKYYQAPERLVQYEYEGLVYCADTSEVSYSVSPNHRMYVSQGDTKTPFFEIHGIENIFHHDFTMEGKQGNRYHIPGSEQYTKPYSGKIYCATVEGGVLYVRGGGKRGFWCGNSMKIGVDMRLARNAKKGPNNILYTPFQNPKTGKEEWVSTLAATQSIIGFPDYHKNTNKFVPAMVKSKGIFFVPREKVEYVLQSGDDMFSEIAQTVPLKSGVKGMRLLMAAKFATAALPLVNREAPFVQTADSKGRSIYEALGDRSGAVRSPSGGIVKSVYKDHMTVLDDSTGETHRVDLYDNFMYPRKTFMRNIPKVKAGQRVKKGDLLAGSNYTDDKGLAAPGRNLRVGYLNYQGYNFEDAVVISQSAAKKLTSEHMYPHKIRAGKDMKAGKKSFVNLFPSKFKKDQLSKVGDDGVIKAGQVVNYGDPLVLMVKEREPEPGTMNRRIRSNAAVTWEHHYPGVVTDAAKTKTGYQVFVRANAPAQMADKLANAHGGKGVISKIVPDDEMPRDAQGRPLELLLSPLGIVSRTNSAQLVEAALGKVAAKTGKGYTLPGFIDEDMVEFAQRELKNNNMTDTEDLYDPVTKRNIPKVFVGNAYAYKLQHTSDSKGKARSTSSYTLDEQPAKGGKEGAKHLGSLLQQALVSHSATKVLRDLKIISGQKNDDFWRQLKLGQTPTMPGTPLVYEKFKNLVRAAGVDLRESKAGDSIFAMTRDQAKELTGTREITSGDTYGSSTMQPIQGGLFDPDATGSLGKGNLWSYIKLPEPLPNPIMEEPMRRLLDLKQKEFADLMGGRKEYKGKFGGQALQAMLENLNVDAARANAIETIKSGSKSKRDDAVKKLTYLEALKRKAVKPEDFLMDRVPVLPPKFRPITKSGDLTMVADPNYLYKTILDSIEDYKDTAGLPDSLRSEARDTMYKNYKALVGVTDPVQPDLQQKGVSGILKQVFGKGSPKMGFVQRRVIGTNIDLAGLGVLTPNPALKLNEVGMPESLAWQLYEPFVIRHLVERGVKAADAAKAVADHAPSAYKSLQSVVQERPVLFNRAPSLHKYSVMAMKPVLTKGKTLQVPPQIVAPMGMDFDGDTSAFFVPVSDEAVQEAKQLMLPEKNLLSARNDRPNYMPSNEYLQGLYVASKEANKKPKKKFKTMADALKAYRTGKIDIDDPIEVEEDV